MIVVFFLKHKISKHSWNKFRTKIIPAYALKPERGTSLLPLPFLPTLLFSMSNPQKTSLHTSNPAIVFYDCYQGAGCFIQNFAAGLLMMGMCWPPHRWYSMCMPPGICDVGFPGGCGQEKLFWGSESRRWGKKFPKNGKKKCKTNFWIFQDEGDGIRWQTVAGEGYGPL